MTEEKKIHPFWFVISGVILGIIIYSSYLYLLDQPISSEEYCYDLEGITKKDVLTVCANEETGHITKHLINGNPANLCEWTFYSGFPLVYYVQDNCSKYFGRDYYYIEKLVYCQTSGFDKLACMDLDKAFIDVNISENWSVFE